MNYNILWHVFIASAVGGLISLDRVALFQVMVSRPIVTGPLIGLVCGAPATGAVIGALLELLWIGDLPLGSHVPPHETAAAVIATAIAVNTRSVLPGQEILGLCILMVIPFAVICQKVDEWIRGFNSHYYYRAVDAIDGGDVNAVGKFSIMAVLNMFAVNTR